MNKHKIQEGLYTLQELRSMLSEDSEFKPKKGENVDTEDKKNNKKAVNDINKETKAYNDVNSDKKNVAYNNLKDNNKTTLDYTFAVTPDDSYKQRVKDLAVNGDNSKDTDDSVSYDGNKEFVKNVDDKSKERNKMKKINASAGLKAREIKKDIPNLYDSNTVFEGLKKLHFNDTRFLNESQIFQRIPDEYKTNGNKFVMCDKTGTNYIIECTIDSFGIKNFSITNAINTDVLKEEYNRITELSNYTYDNSKKKESKNSIEESHDLLNIMRNLLNDNK